MGDVTTSTITFLSLVLAADPDHYLPDQDVYKFSNGRGFESTD